MKKIIILILFCFSSLSFAQEKDSFQNRDRLEQRLSQGEIFTDGGFEGKAVWGKMKAVINVPPEIVWKLFIKTNDWKYYKMPTLADSHTVNAEILRQVGSSTKSERFYQVFGSQFIDPFLFQKKGQKWTGYFFQFFDLPWPVANHWMIVKADYDEAKIQESTYRCDWVKEAGNIVMSEGSFKLSRYQGDRYRTLFDYDVVADTGSSVPKFLLKWGIKSTMPGIVQAIRKVAQEEYGRPPPILQTQ